MAVVTFTGVIVSEGDQVPGSSIVSMRLDPLVPVGPNVGYTDMLTLDTENSYKFRRGKKVRITYEIED